ncbi:uncharacterized protein PAC_16847 [Phialocephala subalpina]|uniref:Uncharacterized protein n=1 Tax=Phialocephala subalpina TaxID=576137 RepID=A0A1L7XPQ0_9HELO|nr:uncharacterized protein PAC_16847 [Phialocephala subalpina]
MDGEKRRVRVELALLKSLRFPEMNHRYERVAEAHEQTFLWAFRDPRPYEKPWDNFVEWLSERNGIYWIQGKAASGKSTLMRFIWHNDLTQCNLKLWSRDSQLVEAAFFFWNSGVPEERLQLGLLRSLLFNSLAQLQKAFARLIECASRQLKMCFFIDGLDEYEGDPEEIAQYFKDLSLVSENTKFCLSSRPWPIFQDIYQDTPGLRVQDMTRDDIKLYIEDKLERSRSMQELRDEDPEGSLGLIEELVSKADSVFLWVVLVVKSLISGLRNGDGIVHLRRRLKAIPADLQHLYDHILDSIDPFDEEEASQMIQIFRLSGHDIDLATLERALRTMDYRTVINMEFVVAHNIDYKASKYNASLKRMNSQLNSRCMGLLEALNPTLAIMTDTISEHLFIYHSRISCISNGQNKRKRNEGQHFAPPPPRFRPSEGLDGGFYHSEETALNIPPTASFAIHDDPNGNLSPFGEDTSCETELLKIFYLHRTVRDYLEQPKVWKGLLDKTRPTAFDPFAALLIAYIMELKILGISSKGYLRGKYIVNKVDSLNIPAFELCISLKLELNEILTSLWGLALWSGCS